ncbi:MAG: UDP-N-acetylmuramate dehydrogenase [Xanthomonadales bacterium]|nr:UDP-N-acetylmuramate dehydrogenase [Xanthomonadales bacterium]
MQLSWDVDLRPLNTLRVPARAWGMARVEHWYHLESVLQHPEVQNRPLLALGGGSNVLFRRDFPGLILRIENQGIQILEEEEDHLFVRVAAGESWHDLVQWSVRRGFWGIENLAFIPGLTGAAPIQNIGAYGTELSECLESVQAFDRQQARWRTLSREQCRLAYRSSRFRDDEPDRFLIAEIVLRLSRRGLPRTDYPGISQTLADMDVTDPGPVEMAECITRLRKAKLPDPLVVPNVGSFFKNPIVDRDQAERLQTSHPRLPVFDTGSQAKLSAGWMIEQCGWKDFAEGDAAVSSRHALVLVNRGTATGQQIWDLALRIEASVFEKFGVRLEPEPQVY